MTAAHPNPPHPNPPRPKPAPAPATSPAGGSPGTGSTRSATSADVPYLVDAVRALIAELRGVGATTVDLPRAETVAAALVSGGVAGAAVIAVDGDGRRCGVATSSHQDAIRTGGRHAVIQELWVDPAVRGKGIGRALVSALCSRAAAAGCGVVEVGIPGPASPVFQATRDGYRSWGFKQVGPRMRKVLADAGD